MVEASRATPSRAGHLRVRGIELAYAWYGPSHGRPFVLVHGFTGSSDDWREHLAGLSERGPAVTLDLRGHGGSTNLGDPAAYTLEQAVADLAAALAELGIADCDLLGHSMGGAIALRFALAYPERLRSLVLMDTSDRPIRLAPAAQLEMLVKLIETGGTQALLELIRSRADQRAPAQRRYEQRVGSEQAWARVEAKLRAMDPAAFVGFARALAGAESVRARLGEIRCPTLVIVGEEDTPFLEPSEAMAQGIPGARKSVISDAAHSPQLESPKLWSEAISQHLERARRDS